ncbi:hypothetical protein Tco_1065558, partial [Tanacetum coccineum]
GNPQYTLQDQGIFDSGFSKHMTGNKFYLLDYQDIDGGFVAFARSPKGGKITGKDDVYKVAAESLIPSPPVDFLFNHLLLLYSKPKRKDEERNGGEKDKEMEFEIMDGENEMDADGQPLTKQMWDRFRVESSSSRRLERIDMRMDSFDDDLIALDSTFREQICEEKAEYNHMEAEYYKNHWTRMSWNYNDLSGWEDNAVRADAAGDHDGESVDTTAIVKDVGEEKDDEGDNVAAAKDSQS